MIWRTVWYIFVYFVNCTCFSLLILELMFPGFYYGFALGRRSFQKMIAGYVQFKIFYQALQIVCNEFIGYSYRLFVNKFIGYSKEGQVDCLGMYRFDCLGMYSWCVLFDLVTLVWIGLIHLICIVVLWEFSCCF